MLPYIIIDLNSERYMGLLLLNLELDWSISYTVRLNPISNFATNKRFPYR